MFGGRKTCRRGGKTHRRGGCNHPKDCGFVFGNLNGGRARRVKSRRSRRGGGCYGGHCNITQ